jgi:hypothetical protein
MQESAEETDASLIIPTDSVVEINGPNLALPWTTVHTVRRKAAKRSEKWYEKSAAPLPTPSRKKRRLEEPLLPLRRSSHGLIMASSTGASVPPSNATDVASTRRQSACQTKTQLSPIETSKAQQLDGDDDANVGDCSRAFRGARLSELAEYRKLHGHCNVPRKYIENTKLANWVMTQRKQYKVYQEGKTSAMTPFRIQELENMGFVWNILGTTWQDRLSELADYRRVHGHCNVPNKYSENPKLGKWVDCQRSNYTRFHKKGNKSQEMSLRIQELESLGFEWDYSGVTWEGRLSELADYCKIHGHCNVPKNYSKNKKLGGWVKTQRSQQMLHFKGLKSNMTLYRIQALKSLGF